MGVRVFLAGASGVVGLPLVKLLVGAGHQVTGMGRSPQSAKTMSALGADYVAVDVFDAEALAQAIVAARPDVIIHQLTDLPTRLDPSLMGEAALRNARIREEGTRNLVQGALSAGVRRMIAQSIAWAYAEGKPPYTERDPLDVDAQRTKPITMRGIIALETLVLSSPPLEGVVLRYGNFYGPDTGRDKPEGPSPLHVEAAAYAALCAVEHWQPGIFNIAEPRGEATSRKAMDALGWRADFRLAERTA
ncbi:NAD-dependent epimerase/dehydratase family protein [Taklimakanibacter deserti]|uniref:NAD-dependent epimerase/dehydratase family protein n=1 Tax=Taklimakanibacter deserti TaxID=2267839 RepID=UPI000E64A5E2